MKKSHSEKQIIKAIKQHEAGGTIQQVPKRKHQSSVGKCVDEKYWYGPTTRQKVNMQSK